MPPDWPVAAVLGAGVGSTREGGDTLVLGGEVGGAPVGLKDLVAGALGAAPGDDAAPPDGAPPVCPNASPANTNTVSANPANTNTVSANHILRMFASQCVDSTFNLANAQWSVLFRAL